MQINKINTNKYTFGMPFIKPEMLEKTLIGYRDNVHKEIGEHCLGITDWLKKNSGSRQYVSCTETTKGLFKKSPALRFEIHTGLPDSSNAYSITVKNRGTLKDLAHIGNSMINIHNELVRRRYQEIPNLLGFLNGLKKLH